MKTAIILGNAESKSLYDHSRTDADVFVFNEAANTSFKGKRVTHVLQLHDRTIWTNPNNRNDPTHYDWLKQADQVVLMQDKFEDVPNSARFPREEALVVISNGRANGKAIREVSCSPAWTLAYCIYSGYEKIEIYGVELSSNTEYSYQQGNFKFWFGVAIGRGIQVDIYSSMFDAPQYGYEGEVSIPYDVFEIRINELMPKYQEASAAMKAKTDALNFAIDKMESGDFTKEVMPAVESTLETYREMTAIDGRIQANKYYKQKADAMIETSEKFIFSRQEFEFNSAQAQVNAQRHKTEFDALAGQMQLVHANVLNAAKGSPKRKKLLKVYGDYLKNYISKAGLLAGWQGAAEENFAYMARLDAGIKAAGGQKSEEAINKQ